MWSLFDYDISTILFVLYSCFSSQRFFLVSFRKSMSLFMNEIESYLMEQDEDKDGYDVFEAALDNYGEGL